MQPRFQQRNPQFHNSLAGAFSVYLVLLVFCAGRPGYAQQNAAGMPATVAATPVPVSTPGKSGDKAANVGIKVHGHWTIEVRNPNGTLAQHHEFENALQTSGAISLIQLMTGGEVPSDMAIALLSPSGQTPPCGPSGDSFCMIVRSLKDEPATSFCTSSAVCSVTLTSVVNVTTEPYSLTYSGNFQAIDTGSIADVQTVMGICTPSSASAPDTNSPAACSAGTSQGGLSYLYFSATQITPVSVAAGQIVQVTVAFTFS